MSTKTTTNREALVKVAALVRPALASQAYIPALNNILFDGDYATAYNDISAISVRVKLELECSVPGELLIRALGSFGSEQILFQPVAGAGMVLSSGRSKIKLPTLPVEAFPFEWPDEKTVDGEIELDADVLKGVERCLISVGNDPTHPAQMGVTLDVDTKGRAVLFSTDNFTISRFQTKTKVKLPGDTPIILPRFFCEQLVTLSKAFPEDELTLTLYAGALQVDIGKSAKLFTKTPVDLEPLDFQKIVAKHCDIGQVAELLAVIPDSFDAAFGRALLVLSGEMDKATKVTLDDGFIKLSSTSSMGDSDDSLKYDDGGETHEPFHIDPSLVARASKSCAQVGFAGRVMVLADADSTFLHLIAHCSV
jgi:DNA polymerase III sliding clamp (beta) subunit (PCNA family)